MMNNRLLTLITPSYNMEKYLPKCLGSLVCDLPCRGGEGVEERREERLGEGEGKGGWLELLDVIVVNDGSKDRTSEIAHEFEAKYPGVFRVIDKENGHYGSCVNAALKVARGEYVRILDPDDWFDKSEFGRFLVELADLSKESVDLVLTDYELVDESGETISFWRQPFEEGPVEAKVFFEAASGSYYPALPGLTYRTSLFKEVNYHQTEGVPYTDAEWIVYPMAAVNRIVCRHLCVYKYFRGRDDQTMSALNMARRWQVIDTRVMKALVEQSERFLKLGSEAFRAYFCHSIKEILSPAYGYGILRRHEVRFSGGVLGFDRFLRETSPGATRVMEEVLMPFIQGGRYLLHAPYVKWLHEGRTLRLRIFVTLWRMYSFLVKMKGRVCGKRS